MYAYTLIDIYARAVTPTSITYLSPSWSSTQMAYFNKHVQFLINRPACPLVPTIAKFVLRL